MAILGRALVLCFVVCCIASALLQIIAWARHTRPGVAVDLRALWRPEAFFDDIGLHQMQLARRLLLLGGCAYLAFGGVLIATSIAGK